MDACREALTSTPARPFSRLIPKPSKGEPLRLVAMRTIASLAEATGDRFEPHGLGKRPRTEPAPAPWRLPSARRATRLDSLRVAALLPHMFAAGLSELLASTLASLVRTVPALLPEARRRGPPTP